MKNSLSERQAAMKAKQTRMRRGEVRRMPEGRRRQLQEYRASLPYFIYGLADPRDGELFWIGRTRNMVTRYRTHFNNKPSASNPLHAAKMYDLKHANAKPVLIVFEITEDKSRETFYIEAMCGLGCKLLNIHGNTSTN